MTCLIPNVLLLLLLTLAPLISALVPNVTAIPIAPGTCQGWPGYMSNPIGNLTQQFFFEPRDTSNSSLDGLRSSLSPSSSPSSSSIQLITNTDPTVPYNIFSCANNGSVFDIQGGPTLVYSMNEQDQELGYSSENGGGGSRLYPEVYTHEIAGVQQDGLFVGLGNVTTWGFEFVLGQGRVGSSDYYRMRLLGPETNLKDGEIDGFLGIVALNRLDQD
ncbi:hypothetical protein N431DRAFT_440104 [Stipitochalara longipes BDJ]|nr:hypothetical protein N431DRAFT_440104 [Stipitochalara longipes BDJ]